MGAFRPVVSLTDPSGRAWEVYATRFRPPERKPGGGRRLRRALVRLLVDYPRAALLASRSDTWTIEAISWLPHRTTYTWRTTAEYRGHVLAQVEGQLARGEIPHPGHADFLGARG